MVNRNRTLWIIRFVKKYWISDQTCLPASEVKVKVEEKKTRTSKRRRVTTWSRIKKPAVHSTTKASEKGVTSILNFLSMSYIRPEGRSKQHFLRPETTLLVTRMFLAFHSEYVCLLFIPHNINLVKLLDIIVFTIIVSMCLESNFKLKPISYGLQVKTGTKVTKLLDKC